MLNKHVISIHCSTGKKNISRNFQLQFQSMELRTHLWWESLSFLYLAENSWGKRLSSISLSQEIKIIITDHQLPFDWSTSTFDAFSSVNRSWPEARPPSHLLLQVQSDGREQRPKGDPWAVLPEATLGSTFICSVSTKKERSVPFLLREESLLPAAHHCQCYLEFLPILTLHTMQNCIQTRAWY